VASEVIEMSKSLVTKTWVGGLAAVVVGLLIAGFSVGMMLAFGGTWHSTGIGNNYQFTPAQNAEFWTAVAGIVTGGVVVVVGALVQLIAWIGALINTYAVPDRTWFVVLLVGGLLGFFVALAGLAVMVAYLVAGPDGMPAGAPPAAPRQPATLTPTGEWR
jgi:hypothetical protein